jgi:hypothetical protein
MPRDGSLILSDVREPTLALVCETRGPSFEHSAAPTFMVFDNGPSLKPLSCGQRTS